MPNFGRFARTGAHRGSFRFVGMIVAAALAALLSGCILSADYPFQSKFKDPKRSLVLLYVRYDKDAPHAWYAHLRHKGGTDDVALMNVDDPKKMSQCILYVGVIPSGDYEFIGLSTDRLAYKFPKGSEDNYDMRVGKRRDIYMLGRFELRVIKKKEGEDNDSFISRPTHNCPSTRTAYRMLLVSKTWKDSLNGSSWHRRLEAKVH